MDITKIEIMGQAIKAGQEMVSGNKVVYAIFFNDRVKVGKSANVTARVSQIEKAHGKKAKEAWCFPFGDSYSMAEKYIHDLLKEKRIVGEYFKATKEEVKSCFEKCYSVNFNIEPKKPFVFNIDKANECAFNLFCKHYGWTTIEAVENLVSRLNGNDKDKVAAMCRFKIVKKELEQVILRQEGNIETINEVSKVITQTSHAPINSERYFVKAGFAITLAAKSIEKKRSLGHSAIVANACDVANSLQAFVAQYA